MMLPVTSFPECQVVVISLDGLRPEFYLDPEFEVPSLRRLREAGCHASGVEPVYPSLTYPNHTTLVTGALPSAHGIVSNSRFERETGPLTDWYWEEKWIRVPTLWQIASARGRKVGIVRWPVTVGAQCEWVIPEVFAAGQETGASSFEFSLRAATPGLLQEIFRSEHVSALPEDLGPLAGRREHDRWASISAAYLLKNRRPDLILAHLIEVDHAQHEYGRVSYYLRESLAAADQSIQRILDAIDFKKTRVVVVGDHGFSDFQKLFRINQFLEEKGWASTQPGWRAVAHVDGGMAAIYIRNSSDSAAVLESLEAAAGAAYRILDRAELGQIGAFPDAFCALDPLPGVSLKGGVGSVWETLDRVRGRHGNLSKDGSMDAGALFCGPGIQAGSSVGRIRMQDIAVWVASWLGLELPAANARPLKGRIAV